MAASSSMIVWTILYYIKNKTFSFLELIVGTVAGLATVTPASGYITPISAFVIGAIAGLVCFYCVEFEHKWKRLDDALDVWGVHGMGGFIGTLCIGIFANPIVNRITPGIISISNSVNGKCISYCLFYNCNLYSILDIR